VTVLLAAVVVLGLPALSGASGPARAADAGDDTGRLVLVLDASGSMKERTPGGETRIDAARTALEDVVASLPDAQPVGLRVYGAEVFSRDEPGACEDSQLVVPVETGNRGDLRAAIDDYEPYGETPTGYALQQAGKDLGDEGKRSIVLVSDGEPTCDPDPCEVAKELSKDGVDVRIDVVGLDVSGKAREELQCVARQGNGSYYDVDSSDELSSSLEKLATRASRDYTTIGRPVVGTESAADAPEVQAGDWVDSLPASSTRSYRVKRDIAGSTIHVGGTLRSDVRADDVLQVELASEQGQSCGGDGVTAERASGALMTASATATDTCAKGDVVVSVKRENGVDPTPLELRVVEEPPVEDEASLPEPDSSVTWEDPPVGRSGEAVGGASFDDAPLLEPGTYTDTIVPGEALTYQVDAEWGQQVVATVEYPKASGRLAEAIGDQGQIGTVAIVNPARARAGLGAQATGSPPNQSLVGDEGQTLGNSTAPITYRNREVGGAKAAAALAGRYTVVVGLEDDPDGEDYLVPVTVRIGVVGEPTGEPTYTEPAPDPDAEPAASEAQDDDGSSVVPWLLAGVAVVAAVVGGVLVARSRRGRAG
jgi:Ca-activated chloride channel family protein